MSLHASAWVAVGVVLALTWTLHLLHCSQRRQIRSLAVGLLILPLCYVGFALAAGHYSGLPHEGMGVLLYGVLALLGQRQPGWLALGWLGHIAWDLATPELHAGYVPDFYGPLCLGFDGVIGLLAARLAWRPPARSAQATHRRTPTSEPR